MLSFPALVFRSVPMLAAAAMSVALAGCTEQASRPNVLLITIDTLRADHLGAYGYERPVSPRIDRLASSGIRFERAFSQAPWTLPSMASLHTSLYPSQHGANARERGLSEQVSTLAEELQAAGYHTMGVVSHMFVAEKHGFKQGFERWDESNVKRHRDVTSQGLSETAAEMLRAESDGPFFLWVHYFDPHSAYVRHEAFDFGAPYSGRLGDTVVLDKVREQLDELDERDLDYVRALYDGEIAFTDHWIGELLDTLNELDLADDTLVFLTSDHGEEFLEHDQLGHGKFCYDELVRVPLILSGDLPAALRGRVHDGNVELRSLARTIAEVCGVRSHAFGGQNLIDAVRTEGEPPVCLIEGNYAWGDDHIRRAVVYRDWKLIKRLDEEAHELYHLARDPGEQHNLWDAGTSEVEAARSLLVPMLERVERRPGQAPAGAADVEHTLEELEQLRELGYAGDEADERD